MQERISAVRSKESIVHAMFALMESDDYEKISISEIASRAGIDRRTFYRHFKTKDDNEWLLTGCDKPSSEIAAIVREIMS